MAVLLAILTSIGLGAKAFTGSGRPPAGTAAEADCEAEARRAHTARAPGRGPRRPRDDGARVPRRASWRSTSRSPTEGLNTIQLDVKDENGEIGFVPSAVPLATKVSAARPYYRPRQVARMTHAKGVYLIGRVVVFEDPRLSEGAPEHAIKNADGSVWRNDAGLGWSNPYDKRVWDYNVSIAEVAARAGFDEIQFDYVRFPTDGDIENAVFPGKTATPPGWVIAQFVHYASKRLKPLGVRVSADVFGLAATRDLGIGQVPKRLAKYVDAMYPMVYPSHYGSGEYGLDDPNGAPGETVAYSLTHFRRELRGSKAQLIPWLQDFDYGRTYGLAEVQDQIAATRQLGARGYLLWNPEGVYTPGRFRLGSPLASRAFAAKRPFRDLAVGMSCTCPRSP